MTKIKAIFFDFDGVLVDTFEMHYQNIINYLIPDATREDFSSLFDGNFYDELDKKERFKKVDELDPYTRKSLKEEHLVKELVLFIKKTNLPFFIITSNFEEVVIEYLEKQNIEHYFEKILGFETHKSKVEKFKLILKEKKLEPIECLFITDTIGDLYEAKKIKIPTIAVTWGFHKKEKLESANPNYLAQSPKECVELIEKLLIE